MQYRVCVYTQLIFDLLHIILQHVLHCDVVVHKSGFNKNRKIFLSTKDSKIRNKMASGISQRLAYKGMLLKISNHLSSANLRDLKHLLRDELPADQLNEATQGTDIFNLLEVRGRLMS